MMCAKGEIRRRVSSQSEAAAYGKVPRRDAIQASGVAQGGVLLGVDKTGLGALLKYEPPHPGPLPQGGRGRRTTALWGLSVYPLIEPKELRHELHEFSRIEFASIREIRVSACSARFGAGKRMFRATPAAT